MSKALFIKREKNLVDEWISKFMEFSDLINQVSGSEVAPTEQEELSYSRFRGWFIQRECVFLPLWLSYLECQDRKSGGMTGPDFDTDGIGSAMFINNPFGFYYHPETLMETFVHLELQKPDTDWVSCDDQAGVMRTVLIGVLKIAVEFHQWVFGIKK